MKEIKIVKVTPITCKNGQSFLAYKTVTKTGRFMDVKFTKDIKDPPEEPCVLLVNEENCNIQKNTQFPVLWIKEIEEIKPIERRKDNLDEFFD